MFGTAGLLFAATHSVYGKNHLSERQRTNESGIRRLRTIYKTRQQKSTVVPTERSNRIQKRQQNIDVIKIPIL